MNVKNALAVLAFSGMIFGGSVAFAADCSPGIYQANTNVNIRAAASFLGKAINHLNKGQTISVESQKGSWCKVTLPKHRHAYIKAKYLNSTVYANKTVYLYPTSANLTNSVTLSTVNVSLPSNTAKATGIETSQINSTALNSNGTSSASTGTGFSFLSDSVGVFAPANTAFATGIETVRGTLSK